MSDTVSNLWAGLDPEIDRRLREKIKPNPATGELDDGDILMYLRELEDDPDLQAMLEHGNAERKRREESIDFDTFDFGSLPSTPSTWRVTLEPGGLVDPETKSIVRPHEVDAFPDARQTFRVTGWVPSQKMRYVEDFEELPKSGELTLFLKNLFVIPFGNYQPQTPANLIMSHKFALHEHAIAPFLDSIPSMSWRIESQDQGAFVNDMVYQIASRDYKRHLAAGLKAKERGNEFFKNNDRRRAIDAYTESLRRYEDAIAQKVMEHEKAAVFKHIAVVCANRSFAYVKEGMGPGRDVETGIIDAENAIYADKTYSKA
ncbi:hypothetical protein CC2G_003947 [Coprinopsis cinerea AmutBmut pab1-1]|nr:hypothetical protein CC2G_003947 [Coprinopsis cinerea AmutBmut pab1-1]